MRHSVKMIVLLSLLLCSFNISAQKDSLSKDKSLSPYFLVKSDNPDTDKLPLLETTADVNIAGVIADVSIHQVYKNEGKNPLEAVYTFPASTNAAVYAMEMKVGDRTIVAKIEEQQEAKEQYEEAKEEGKRASLLEQERPNVFKMNVANIMPGDSITVTLKYTELLIPEDGLYKFIYPTVVGPRYAGETSDKGSDDNEFVNTPYQHEGNKPLYNFDINVDLSMGMPLQDVTCSTHDININYPSTEHAEITLDKSDKKGGNRDFVLEYRLAGNEINTGTMLYEGEDENFFLSMIQPPKRIEEKDIPPREYVFINDVSGSMRGFPMDVSKKLMRNLVSNLRPKDRFNVMVFAGSSGWMADKSINANQDNINQAVKFVDSQRGGGGTNILSALKRALKFPRQDKSVSRTFVIVTDGYVNVEKEAFDLIRENNNNANVFVFGIGSSVNRYLIEGMAHCGKGKPFIVKNKSESNEKAEKFRKYISSPVLTQIEKKFEGFDTYDVEPLTTPDVFAQRPILIYGKYRNDPTGSIKLKGYSGEKQWNKNVDVSSFEPSPENEALRYLWARKRIQLLSDYGHVQANNEKEITELGLKYNLLTDYTSFVAIQEKVVNEDGESKTVKQPLPLPQGVSDAAVGGVGVEMEANTKQSDRTVTSSKIRSLEEAVAEEPRSVKNIRYYNKIKIKTSFASVSKKDVRKHINKNLMPELNQCFIKTQNPQKKMTIVVDADGNIKEIQFDESNKKPNKNLKSCLRSRIQKWELSKYEFKKDWKFDIKF